MWGRVSRTFVESGGVWGRVSRTLIVESGEECGVESRGLLLLNLGRSVG